MSQKHNIDDFFKEQLADHEMDAPMHLWDDLYAKREKQKRILPPWWSWRKIGGLIVVLLLTLPLAYWINNPVVSKGALEDRSVTSSIEGKTLHTVLEEGKGTNTTNTIIENNTTKTTPQNNSSTQNNTVYSEDEVKKKDIGSSSVKESQSGATVDNVKTNNSKEINTTKPIALDNTKKAWEAGSGSYNVTKIEEVETTFNEVHFIDAKPLDLLETSFDAPKFAYIPPKKLKCAHFNQISQGLYIDANLAVNITHRQLVKKASMSGSSTYLGARKSSEFPLFSYGMHLGVSQQFASGVTLRSGVDYTVINELFQFKIGTETETLIKTLYDADGNPVGTDTVQITRDVFDTKTNTYKMIDIPLLLGYELNFPDFSLNAYAGPIVNVGFKASGQINSKDDDLIVPIQQNEQYFKQTLGVGWYASIGFGYKFTPKTQLRFEPYVKGYMGSLTADEHPVDQKYTLTGLRIGIRQKI